METTTDYRNIIADEIRQLSAKHSQNKVAARAGVSAATISAIVNGNWKIIREEMWRKIQNSLQIDLGWKHADTKNFRTLQVLLRSAQERSMALAISYKEGRCKSHSYKYYSRYNENVIYVECKQWWTKKNYVQALMRAAGIKNEGSVGELIEQLVAHIRGMASPMIINDQFDKLKDPSMDLFMDFYNDLEGHCAFVLSGVPALEKKVLRGVNRDKIGYREMYSRIGRKFIKLDETSLEDVTAVCKANGVTDEDKIIEIYNMCEGDMRRVRREVQRYFLMQSKTAA